MRTIKTRQKDVNCMLNLILCDDDPFTLRLVTALVEAAIQKSGVQARISCIASSGSELLAFLGRSSGPFLYFLDFDLGKEELNGIDLVKQIYQKDAAAKIVFVTSHTEKGMDILKSGIQAFGLIEKTPDQKAMISEYSRYLNMASSQGGQAVPAQEAVLRLPLGIDETAELPVSQVLYVDSVKSIPHAICYHTFDGSQITVRDTIEHALELLGDGFIRCHRSVVVSKQHILSLKNGLLKLSNGESVTYALGKRREILAACSAKEGR